jgi:hypothetical protein
LPDVYAAIFFGELSIKHATEATLRYLAVNFPDIEDIKIRAGIAQDFAISLAADVEHWKASIRPGVNIIDLW